MSTSLAVAVSPPSATAAGARRRLGTAAVPAALAALSGVLYGTALPPTGLRHLAWVCLLPLLRALVLAPSPRHAAGCGFLFALLFSALTAGWLPGAVSAFFAQGPAVGWLAGLGVYTVYAGLPFALFGGLGWRLLRSRSLAAVPLGVPALVVAAELLRAHVAGGLPWSLLGHSMAATTTLIQVADLGGVYAVSFVIATVNVALFVALDGRSARRRAVAVAIALVVTAGALGYGQARLHQLATADGAAVVVGVLQPDRPPVYHASQVNGDRALLAYVRQSAERFARGQADVIVWPEHALPFYVDRDRSVRTRLEGLARRLDATLVVGAPAADPAAPGQLYNAAHLVGPDGSARVYRKRRLVPFAEYRPWQREATAASPAFVEATEPVVFEAAGVRFGPTICLDLIYPEIVASTVRAGAEVLLNLSNDGWLAAGGRGAEEQQLIQARFRAVETRRDLARATTTGISAVVDASGTVRGLLGEHRAGALRVPVHPRRALTPYTRWGDAFAFLCVAVAGLAWRLARP